MAQTEYWQTNRYVTATSTQVFFPDVKIPGKVFSGFPSPVWVNIFLGFPPGENVKSV